VSVALTLRKLAEVAAEQGETVRALDCCSESLALGQEAGHASVVGETLEVAARVLRRRGRPADAARLLGAADVWRDHHQATRDQPYLAAYAREEAALRQSLGDIAFEAERAAGRALRPERAMSLASFAP
jgi:hypothetical protein